MAARTTTSTRWVTGILVVALLSCVLVVVGLIQITGASPSSSGSESPSADSASPSPSDDPTSTAPSSTPSDGRPATTAPTTTPVELAGSGLVLPAAWTGTADMTITVHGRCAAIGGTSFYTRPAQFALQVSPTPTPPSPADSASASAGGVSASAGGVSASAGGMSASAPSTPTSSPTALPPFGPVSMTLGITPTDVPGLSIYSTSSGRDGSIRRTWVVDATADPASADRTLISATLVDDQPLGGALPPNLLVDSETDLQPCETDAGVRLPRPLARGATVTGWVSATEALLQVQAGTTDGERSVQATLNLTRTPGP